MFTTSLYLLLTISIVTKYSDGFVVDNSASMRNEVKSQTDNRPTSFFDSNNNNSNSNNVNEVGNHIRTSATNVTAIDNAMEMPKPNDAVDYSSRDSDDALADVETGRKKYGGGGISKFPKFSKYGKIGKLGGGKKKKYKWLYPIIIGVFLTKMFMFPLFVKAVTILSTSAFMFSKMSLLASLILGLKFFLANNYQNNDSKVEIVHVPMKKYSGDWDRETSESKFHNVFPDNIYEHELRPTRFHL
ncbi:uncharacterized protein LOC129566878 [Sitodiplosis mosellana]|uniref:uncharacterized protein LOC129566878 n=1 Tax=Sitodiplosis mosellana TaxID=263140 RepID=UPI0024452F15|nr:uncharacterized protein LOC129566878 [Sitodiplosis mosellana]